jgi:hypothetical protein
MQAALCLCYDEYKPNLAWDDGAVDIHSFAYAPLMNKTISGDGWCAADQLTVPEFELLRPCSQAVIIDSAPALGLRQPYFHIGFPTVVPNGKIRRFSLLIGTGKPGWFRL